MKPERFEAVLLLPRLRVQNANAISSPLTWGFPPPSAFTGFAHALQRRLNAQGVSLSFGSIGITCHQFEPQTVRPPGRYTQVFNLTRNPLDKEGKTQAIVEEGRTHLEVSLLITVAGDGCPESDEKCQELATHVLRQAEGMRLAGGSILANPQRKRYPALWVEWPTNREGQASAFTQLRRRLAPGFVLVSRAQLLADHVNAMQKVRADATALDALLDLCALHYSPPAASLSAENTELVTSDEGNKGDDANDANNSNGTTPGTAQLLGAKDWTIARRKPGWLVPLPVGYAAISPLYAPGEVKKARDNDTPFRFVESVLSLGEWVGPHRIKTLDELLWRHHALPDVGLYVIQNGPPITKQTDTTVTV